MHATHIVGHGVVFKRNNRISMGPCTHEVWCLGSRFVSAGAIKAFTMRQFGLWAVVDDGQHTPAGQAPVAPFSADDAASSASAAAVATVAAFAASAASAAAGGGRGGLLRGSLPDVYEPAGEEAAPVPHAR